MYLKISTTSMLKLPTPEKYWKAGVLRDSRYCLLEMLAEAYWEGCCRMEMLFAWEGRSVGEDSGGEKIKYAFKQT